MWRSNVVGRVYTSVPQALLYDAANNTKNNGKTNFIGMAADNDSSMLTFLIINLDRQRDNVASNPNQWRNYWPCKVEGPVAM